MLFLEIALHGTAGRVPLPNCQIVLRASQDRTFVPIAETTTDSDGQFSFTGLSADGTVIYLPGANRQDVHYPGTRIRLEPRRPTAQVQLIAFDAVESPSPLVTRRHEIEVRPGTEFLDIAETLVVENPTLTAYIGQSEGERAPVTLRLSLPEMLEKVTFEREFHGRNFQLLDNSLTTDIPWRPGKQELKFMYRLPADQKHKLFVRLLDRPTDHLVVRVVATDTDKITCNLPPANDRRNGEVTFERNEKGESLPAGYAVELQLGSLPIGFAVYARWTAVVLLFGMMLGTVIVARRGKQRMPAREGVHDLTHKNKRRSQRNSQRSTKRSHVTASSPPNR